MYDKAFFDWFVPHRPLYRPVADWLGQIKPDSVLDLGCGNGFLLDMIGALDSVGVDFVDEARDAMPKHIRSTFLKRDLTKPIDLGRKFDLVICTEVAEHLPEEAADILVDTIERHARLSIFFSAAIPGQGGEGHLNERPHGYWIDKFEASNHLLYMHGPTAEVRSAAPVELSWLRNNGMIFWRTS